MLTRLSPRKAPRLEAKPKTVHKSGSWADHTRIARQPPYCDDLLHIIDCIEHGRTLPPRYYRKNVDTTTDQLLDVVGIKHLHLGGQNSNVLLFLIELDTHVVLLEINDHKNFYKKPIGGTLLSTHRQAMQYWENQLLAAATTPPAPDPPSEGAASEP